MSVVGEGDARKTAIFINRQLVFVPIGASKPDKLALLMREFATRLEADRCVNEVALQHLLAPRSEPADEIGDGVGVASPEVVVPKAGAQICKPWEDELRLRVAASTLWKCVGPAKAAEDLAGRVGRAKAAISIQSAWRAWRRAIARAASLIQGVWREKRRGIADDIAASSHPLVAAATVRLSSGKAIEEGSDFDDVIAEHLAQCGEAKGSEPIHGHDTSLFHDAVPHGVFRPDESEMLFYDAAEEMALDVSGADPQTPLSTQISESQGPLTQSREPQGCHDGGRHLFAPHSPSVSQGIESQVNARRAQGSQGSHFDPQTPLSTQSSEWQDPMTQFREPQGGHDGRHHLFAPQSPLFWQDRESQDNAAGGAVPRIHAVKTHRKRGGLRKKAAAAAASGW